MLKTLSTDLKLRAGMALAERRDMIPGDLSPKTKKPRILCFTVAYPEFSETYMHEEFLALSQDYEVMIVALHYAAHQRSDALPYLRVNYRDEHLSYGRFDRIDLTFSSKQQKSFLAKIDRIIEAFEPQVMHAHYLYFSWLLDHVWARHHIPYTIRTHSFDLLEKDRARVRSGIEALRSPGCIGTFAFPEFVEEIIAQGVSAERVHPAWPLVGTARFLDEAPRPSTGGVICAGSIQKKKAHTDFIDLADRMRDTGRQFRLYGEGYGIEPVKAYNAEKGNPIEIAYAEPADMPGIYRQHDWMVYPSDPSINRVGLPMAVVEAQAMGLGICLKNVPGRTEALRDFLGGGGYLYDELDEVEAILSRPYPEEMRQAGFANAKRCDVSEHKRMLDAVWAPFLSGSVPAEPVTEAVRELVSA